MSAYDLLIADGERLYDPDAYHDRLLLGLSGISRRTLIWCSSASLMTAIAIARRLTQGRDGCVTFNPDEEVQERLRLVSAKFRELRSAKAVMRYLRHRKLLLPVRPLHGPAPHDVVWRPADSARVTHILKSPACSASIRD